MYTCHQKGVCPRLQRPSANRHGKPRPFWPEHLRQGFGPGSTGGGGVNDGASDG